MAQSGRFKRIKPFEMGKLRALKSKMNACDGKTGRSFECQLDRLFKLIERPFYHQNRHFDNHQPPFTLDYYYIFISRYYGDSDEDRLELGRAIYQLEQCLHKCIELRKRKELEISLLQQPIRNWSGDSIEKLGTMRLMTQV